MPAIYQQLLPGRFYHAYAYGLAPPIVDYVECLSRFQFGQWKALWHIKCFAKLPNYASFRVRIYGVQLCSFDGLTIIGNKIHKLIAAQILLHKFHLLSAIIIPLKVGIV